MSKERTIHELRVALTVEDFEKAAALYGEALGLRVVKKWDEPHGKGAIFAAGTATIEVLDRLQAEYIDEVEAGERVSGPVRLALGVADVESVSRLLHRRGTEVVAAPVKTPWRLQPAPANLGRHATDAVRDGRSLRTVNDLRRGPGKDHTVARGT